MMRTRNGSKYNILKMMIIFEKCAKYMWLIFAISPIVTSNIERILCAVKSPSGR